MLTLDITFGWIPGRSAIPSYLRSLTSPLTDILLSSNCFQHARIPIMLYYQQPPGPFLHRLSPTSQVLWPRLTSAGSAMPCDMGYIFRCVSHRPPRLRCNSLHPMQPLHLRDRVRVVWDFDLSCRLVRSAPPYMRFLFVSSEFCLRLPSDSASRRTPLPFGLHFLLPSV